MSDRSKINQDPSWYSKEYFMSGCSGSADFQAGAESDHQVFKYLLDLIPTFKDKTVLDVGCGRGEVCLSVARRGAKKVVGIDFSQDAIDLCNENLKGVKDFDQHLIQFTCADALSFESKEKFDVICLADVVEHLYDDQNMVLFSRLKEILNPGGVILIHTMPTREFMDYGQYFKAAIYKLKGKRYDFLTYEDQANITHVNLQSKRILSRYLQGYEYKLWYDFAHKGTLRGLISKSPIVKYISSNLWGIAKRPH